MAAHVKSFDDAIATLGALNRLSPRLRPIPVDRIVGSVGRADQVTRDFLPLPQKERSPRFRSVSRAMEEGRALPPIEVYALRDEYYIIDGHHRVAAARSQGIAYLDALVTELLLPVTNDQNRVHNQKLQFERLTGLSDITLTEPGHYQKLLDQIREHHYLLQTNGHTLSLEDAAQDWYDYVYFPVVEQLVETPIPAHFPDRSLSDVYIYLCDYKWIRSQKRQMDIGFPRALVEMSRLYPPISATERTLRPFEMLGDILAAPLLTVGRLTRAPLRRLHLLPIHEHSEESTRDADGAAEQATGTIEPNQIASVG